MDETPRPSQRFEVDITHADRHIGGIWTPSTVEAAAAWELMVELSTRVPVIPLRQDEGLLEEALASLGALFRETRFILRGHGPACAEHRPGELSLAVLAGVMLNQVIRPVTAYWHPILMEHNETRVRGTSTRQSESIWPEREEFLRIFHELAVSLTQFAKVFAQASSAEEFLRTQLERETVLYNEAARHRAQGRD